MKLCDAIAQAEDRALNAEGSYCQAQHRQLAEWLKEYQLLLPIAEAAGNCVKQRDYGFGADIDTLRKAILPWWKFKRNKYKRHYISTR